jgi:hypothetical protein
MDNFREKVFMLLQNKDSISSPINMDVQDVCSKIKDLVKEQNSTVEIDSSSEENEGSNLERVLIDVVQATFNINDAM